MSGTTRKKRKQGINNPWDGSETFTARPRLFDLGAAASYLGRSVYSLRTLVWNGHVPVVRSGNKMGVDIRDLDRWIDAHSELPDPVTDVVA